MIRGEKILLRLVRESDLETFSELTNDVAASGKFWPFELTSETTLRKRFKEDGLWGERSGTMAICDHDDRLMGEIGFFKTVNYMDEFELGYRIFRPEDRGRGAVTEALSLFTRYLFTSEKVHRIRLMIDVDNIPSQRVAAKCGYQNEGVTRGCMFLHGEYRDMNTFSILRDEVLKQTD